MKNCGREKCGRETLVEPKTGQEELMANVTLLSEHKNRMKVVTDWFKTLFSGLAM